MKKIGITGGIGSGKTVVSNIFKILGCKIYNADERAKLLLDSDIEIRQRIETTFGKELYSSGILNRKLLANIVFNNAEALQTLNSIVHPSVFMDFDKWVKHYKNEPYIIKEAAIMFESGAYKQLDSVILVYSPEDIRIQRVVYRDSTNKESVLSRMKNQMDDKEKMKLSNYIIYNDDEHSLIRQVLELHSIFVK